MKKFTCVIASALVMTCSVSLFPAVVYADSESGTVVLDTSDVSADKDGNVELNKPESVNNFENADIVFKENRGYLKNDSYTMQIVLPAGKEKYESECTRNEPLLLAEMYTYDAQSDNNGYYVYTYGVNDPSLDDGTTLNDIFEEGDEFSMKFTSGDDIYKYKFRYENGNIINIGIFDKNSGDANGNGVVEIADVVAVSSYVGNPDNNPISDKAKIYCDVHNTGDGLTASDILMIQQYIAGTITEF